MRNKLQQLTISLGRVQPRHIRMTLILISLILFILGAGAPDDGGSWPGG